MGVSPWTVSIASQRWLQASAFSRFLSECGGSTPLWLKPLGPKQLASSARSPHSSHLVLTDSVPGGGERVEADAAMWQRIVDTVNANDPVETGEFPVHLMPAGRILGRVVDAVEAGEVPGFSSKDDLFGENIHINHYGKLVIAMVHAAILSLEDPTQFSVDGMSNIYGGAYWGGSTLGREYLPPTESGPGAGLYRNRSDRSPRVVFTHSDGVSFHWHDDDARKLPIFA